MRYLTILITTALFAAELPAQVRRFVPDNFQTVEGQATQGTNWRGPRRYQAIYSSSVLTRLGAPANVTELWFRPDGKVASSARTYDVSVTLSSQGVPAPRSADRTSFRANHGSDAAQVATNVRTSFPAVPAGNGSPRPFAVRIPLRAFALKQHQNLLVELDFVPVDNRDPGPWFMDAAAFPTAGWGISISQTGRGCPDQGELRIFHHNRTNPELLVMNYASAAPTDLPAIFIVGDSDRRLGSLPLPLDLTSLGAPGCFIYNDDDVRIPARTVVHSRGSQVVAQIAVPRLPHLVNARFFGQGIIAHRAANPLGIRVSPSARFHLHTPPSSQLGLLLQGAPQSDVPTGGVVNRVPVLGMN